IELRLTGPWLHTILFEVPLLAIISELYMTGTCGPPDREEGLRRLRAKTARLREALGFEDCVITDFGTRRRYSHASHGEVLPHLRAEFGSHFVGTSNVHFARQLDLVPQGTMAHEWRQSWQTLRPRPRDSHVAAFDTGPRQSRGHLGVAPTDVIGLDAYLRDLDLYLFKLLDGMRHDSGAPFES